MLLYIIRHGEPITDGDGLTELGFRQAEAVGRRMARTGIDRIYASPLIRAQQTAAPACRLLGLECHTEEWAHEITAEEKNTRFPDGVVKTVSAVQNTYFLENGQRDLGYDRAFENVPMQDTRMNEAVAYIEKNGREFLERLGYKEENGIYRIIRPNDDKVALFCHAAFSRAWLSVLLHIPINTMWANFSYDVTGVTVLEFANNENGVTAPRCLRYADCSHLYAEDTEGWL